jgi:HK97 family phage major capsid protein
VITETAGHCRQKSTKEGKKALTYHKLADVLSLLAASPFKFFNDGNILQNLRDRLVELNGQTVTIQAAADAGKRDMTDDESAQLAALFLDIERTRSQIGLRETIEANNIAIVAPQGRQTQATDPSQDKEQAQNFVQAVKDSARNPQAKVAATARDAVDYGRRGWRSIGDYARGVANAGRPGGSVDPRLTFDAPSTFGSEGVGADGGFAVPPEFRTTIMEKVMAETSLLARCDLIDVSGNSLTIPTDETTPWQTTGGIQAYWEGEGNQISQTKPQLQDTTVRLNKLAALVPVTTELLEDAAALGSYIGRKAPEKIDFKVSQAIINGTGVGQPLGILNSPALVTVAEENSQTAATVNFQNIVKMYSRLYGPARQNAVWLINQDVEPQLNSMGFPSTAATTLQFPVYIPPGGISGAPYATLYGRPVVVTQAASKLGTVGDVILTDLKAYLAVQKVGGLRAETSIHLWFDYDQVAFRFILRLAGQPWWNQAIAPFQSGANTLSHYVTLATRS